MGARRRAYEAPEVGAAAARMVRALVRRAEGGDVEALEQLMSLERLTAQAVTDAGAGMHGFGYSWGDLARFTGLTRQAWANRCGALARQRAAG